jgi:hypothetical protein
MENGIFDEYLVKLGFEDDPQGFAKFRSTLGDAASIAGDKTKSIIESLAKWQGPTVGAFAAIGTAALATMDKVADADLEFQLIATKMYVGVDAAKQLTIATNILGHSMDEIAWNPELHKRFDILLSDQQRMAAVIGHDFEPGLKNIRDIRFEFSRMQDELEFDLLPEIVSQVSQGFGGPDLLQKLKDLNGWVITHIPEIASTVAKYLVPVLKDGKQVLGDVVGMLEDTGVAFTNLVGLLSADHSIEGTTFDFDKLLKAVDHVSHGIAEFVGWITESERMLAHLASATALFFSGHYSEAAAEFAKAERDYKVGSGAVAGAVTGTGIGAFGGSVAGGILGTMFLPGVGTAAGAAIGGSLGGIGGGVLGGGTGVVAGWLKQKVDPYAPAHGFYLPNGIGSSPDIHALIEKLSGQYGISAILAHAVAMQESGERQYDVSGNVVSSGKAYGVMQLTPDTARAYGVDARNASQNISGGLQLLADLAKHYGGNLSETLAAYNWGAGNLDKAMAKYGRFDESYLPRETREYIHRIEGQVGSGDIHISNTYYTQPGQSAEDFGKQASDQTIAAIRSASRRQNTSNIAMMGSPYQ